jgi:CRP-like cAMP-binding protein
MQTIIGFSQELTELFQSIHHTQSFDKGAYLFQEDTPASELFIIKSGSAHVSKMASDGRELTLRLCTQGHLVGEISLFNSSRKHMLNGRMTEDGEVAVIYIKDLEEQLEKNHALSLELLKWMSLEHQKTQTRYRDLILNGKKGALYSTLIRLSNNYGVKNKNGIALNINLTNQELANFCGTSREVVNRMLSELRKKGIISTDKGFITIHDLHYIRREIDCEHCPVEICSIS